MLDIGLPTLNGIEVARRIRKLLPVSTILFMSQGSSIDVAQAAFSSGATGYVVKARAGSELLAALESVCQGRRFVSARSVKGKHARVAACGEFAPTLWAQGKTEAAIQVEHLTEELAKAHNVDILCGYVLNTRQRDEENHIYDKICAEHTVVFSW